MNYAIAGAIILAVVFGFVGGVHWSLAMRDHHDEDER